MISSVAFRNECLTKHRVASGGDFNADVVWKDRCQDSQHRWQAAKAGYPARRKTGGDSTNWVGRGYTRIDPWRYRRKWCEFHVEPGPLMTYDPNQLPPLFHIDVVASSSEGAPVSGGDKGDWIIALLRQLATGQDRQNKLLEQILQQTNAVYRRRQAELGQWRQANLQLAQRCKRAAETLSRVQNEFLERLTNEIADSEDSLLDGDFMLYEFVDQFGPRLAQLNGLLQVLSQLSCQPDDTVTPP